MDQECHVSGSLQGENTRWENLNEQHRWPDWPPTTIPVKHWDCRLWNCHHWHPAGHPAGLHRWSLVTFDPFEVIDVECSPLWQLSGQVNINSCTESLFHTWQCPWTKSSHSRRCKYVLLRHFYGKCVYMARPDGRSECVGWVFIVKGLSFQDTQC